MTPWLDFEGKNLEKALQAAAENLSTNKEDLKYDILSYGSSGIFGIVGVKKARIRVYSAPSKNSENEEDSEADATNTDRISNDIVTPVESDVTLKTRNEANPDRIQQATALLKTIVNAITENSQIQIKPDEKRVVYTISGDHCDQLIGRRGQTLESIQYVMDRVINKNSHPRIRLVIDVEGYNEKRQEELIQLANRLAEKVIRNGRPIAIGKLNPTDRKMVHLALKDRPGIKTQSLGDGFVRKLMIIPKKSGPSSQHHVDREN
ncbi:MAG: RNA-binding cell elongation regulator Jag/EloR [Desulfatirhabdiaceae bacterium]